MKNVGILGGGQLGLLLAQSISRLGGRASVYDPDSKAPASYIVANSVCRPWTDLEAMKAFFESHDVITYEFENVNSEALLQLNQVKPLMPAATVLKTTQNRFIEKSFIKENGLPHASFAAVFAIEDLVERADSFGYPCIFKTAFGGYDGKGQFFLKVKADAESAFASLKDLPETAPGVAVGVLEEVISLDLEVSCIVARSPQGEEVAFPIMENIHCDHILDYTICPARIAPETAAAVQEIALKATRLLGVNGLLTTEFFLSKTEPRGKTSVKSGDWHIMINEFAPRPHNSGHVTMKACSISQFDALARILLDMPLQNPQVIGDRSYCMANLLGDLWNPDLDLSSIPNHPALVDLVLYGKEEARPKRKMGHCVFVGADGSDALKKAQSFRATL